LKQPGPGRTQETAVEGEGRWKRNKVAKNGKKLILAARVKKRATRKVKLGAKKGLGGSKKKGGVGRFLKAWEKKRC